MALDLEAWVVTALCCQGAVAAWLWRAASQLARAREATVDDVFLPSAWPTLAIVLVVRDCEAAVADALKNLLAQSYPDFTVVMVDDDSKDATFQAGAEVARVDPRCVALRVGDADFVKLGAPSVHAFELDHSAAHHSVLDVSVDGVVPGFLAVLAPYRLGADGAEGPLDVAPLELRVEGVWGWQITHADGVDVVLLREPGSDGDFTLEGGQRLATDGELTLLRLDGSLGLIVRGSAASLDGQRIVDTDGYDFGVWE